MPTYVYQCRKCGEQFERVQRITDAPLSKCESNGCRGSVFRVIQPVGIQFKGSGFHINDYGRGSRKNGTNGSTKGKDDTKSEPKCESKCDSKCPVGASA